MNLFFKACALVIDLKKGKPKKEIQATMWVFIQKYLL